jgi:hypothetical protein
MRAPCKTRARCSRNWFPVRRSSSPSATAHTTHTLVCLFCSRRWMLSGASWERISFTRPRDDIGAPAHRAAANLIFLYLHRGRKFPAHRAFGVFACELTTSCQFWGNRPKMTKADWPSADCECVMCRTRSDAQIVV